MRYPKTLLTICVVAAALQVSAIAEPPVSPVARSPGQAGGPDPSGQAPVFERVYPLDPGEGVFAYSRISPDGNLLVYASETRGRRQRTIRVVDLRSKEILFTEPGIDAYWSPDGARMIWLSQDGRSNVSIRHHASGRITRGVAPTSLGDYFSWARHDGRDLIFTINSNYYYLERDNALLPAGRVPACDGIGRGDRPLVSREGDRITTFVRGTVVVRDAMSCDFILDTGIRGAKADFAWGGRYIAFHAPKERGRGYDIRVVDLQDRTVRTITSFSGSSYFPSWTRDGRLSFRYDGDDYRGFMMASNILSAPARPLPTTPERIPDRRDWTTIFPETAPPSHELALVLVWGPWSAHSPDALNDLERTRLFFEGRAAGVEVMHAIDPGSYPGDAERLVAREGIRTPRIPLAPERLPLTEAHNQNPTTLLFRDGVLVDRRMGAQTFEQLREWVSASR